MGPTPSAPHPVCTPPCLPGATPCPPSLDAGHNLRSQADLNLGETLFNPRACTFSVQFFPKPAPHGLCLQSPQVDENVHVMFGIAVLGCVTGHAHGTALQAVHVTDK